MRLIGSFQTITIHGRSGTVPVSPPGRSTSVGTAVGIRSIVTRRLLRLSEHGAGTRRRRPVLGRDAGVQLIGAVAGQRDFNLARPSVDGHGDGPRRLVGALRAHS